MENVQDLMIFTQVIESGSFTKAARRLGIANSSVSKRVQALEKSLGVQLIQRSTRSLRVTEEGQLLYQRCSGIKQQIEDASQEISRSREMPKGKVRISVPPLMAHSRLAAQLPSFLSRYPDVSLELHLTERHSDLSEGGFDLSIRTGELADSSMIARRLCSINSVLCAAPGYLERRGRPEHPSELEQHNYLCWIAPDGSSYSQLIFHKGTRSYKTGISGNFTSTDATAIKEAAIYGAGITLMPDMAIKDEVGTGLLEVLLTDYHCYHFPLSLVYPRRENVPAKITVAADFIAEVFSN